MEANILHVGESTYWLFPEILIECSFLFQTSLLPRDERVAMMVLWVFESGRECAINLHSRCQKCGHSCVTAEPRLFILPNQEGPKGYYGDTEVTPLTVKIVL